MLLFLELVSPPSPPFFFRCLCIVIIIKKAKKAKKNNGRRRDRQNDERKNKRKEKRMGGEQQQQQQQQQQPCGTLNLAERARSLTRSRLLSLLSLNSSSRHGMAWRCCCGTSWDRRTHGYKQTVPSSSCCCCGAAAAAVCGHNFNFHLLPLMGRPGPITQSFDCSFLSFSLFSGPDIAIVLSLSAPVVSEFSLILRPLRFKLYNIEAILETSAAHNNSWSVGRSATDSSYSPVLSCLVLLLLLFVENRQEQGGQQQKERRRRRRRRRS